mmetsp:Transcript_18201/g.39281  ORF Transcript_18201/g.39281 Transcript_18201/m.39281 type:complete len:238 (-) Transcript_18201:95-808(-)
MQFEDRRREKLTEDLRPHRRRGAVDANFGRRARELFAPLLAELCEGLTGGRMQRNWHRFDWTHRRGQVQTQHHHQHRGNVDASGCKEVLRDARAARGYWAGFLDHPDGSFGVAFGQVDHVLKRKEAAASEVRSRVLGLEAELLPARVFAFVEAARLLWGSDRSEKPLQGPFVDRLLTVVGHRNGRGELQKQRLLGRVEGHEALQAVRGSALGAQRRIVRCRNSREKTDARQPSGRGV